jgi:two-component system sensor histidine kinase KdpD
MEERLQGRDVSVEVAEDLPLVMMDAVLVGQAMLNLLDNAVKFTPTGTDIRISAFPVGTDLQITVEDHGPGIPEDELGRIFDKFYQGSQASHTGGTGLGLSICRGIIEAHEGRIWARNLPEGGLQVLFTIPVQIVQPAS